MQFWENDCANVPTKVSTNTDVDKKICSQNGNSNQMNDSGKIFF